MWRFPLLLHYLEQQENVEIPQWHNWLLDLLTGANLRLFTLIVKLEGPLILFSTFVSRGSSHRRKSAAWPKINTYDLAMSLSYPGGEEGGNLLVQMISTFRHGFRGGGGAYNLWCKSGLRISFTSMRIRMQTQSHFFTSMRIQIHIKLIRICDHWLSDLFWLHILSLHFSIMSLLSSWILT